MGRAGYTEQPSQPPTQRCTSQENFSSFSSTQSTTWKAASWSSFLLPPWWDLSSSSSHPGGRNHSLGKCPSASPRANEASVSTTTTTARTPYDWIFLLYGQACVAGVVAAVTYHWLQQSQSQRQVQQSQPHDLTNKTQIGTNYVTTEQNVRHVSQSQSSQSLAQCLVSWWRLCEAAVCRTAEQGAVWVRHTIQQQEQERRRRDRRRCSHNNAVPQSSSAALLLQYALPAYCAAQCTLSTSSPSLGSSPKTTTALGLTVMVLGGAGAMLWYGRDGDCEGGSDRDVTKPGKTRDPSGTDGPMDDFSSSSSDNHTVSTASSDNNHTYKAMHAVKVVGPLPPPLDDDPRSFHTIDTAATNPSNKNRYHQQPKASSSAQSLRTTNHSETTTTTTTQQQQQQNPTPPPPPQRYLELLVHNVSHTDVVLNLEFELDASSSSSSAAAVPVAIPASPSSRRPHYARPRFSSFDTICRLVAQQLHPDDSILSFPRHRRSMNDPGYAIIVENTAAADAPSSNPNYPNTYNHNSDDSLSPTGLALARPPRLPDSSSVRCRQNDDDNDDDNDDSTIRHPQRPIRLSHIYFPLLATLLSVWKRQIEQKEYSSRHATVKRVLMLVTGVGSPRNPTHAREGNSTRACATVMRAFLQTIDPDLVVVHIHSDTNNIFRYDENLRFVEGHLMPAIHRYRDAHATGRAYPDEVDSGSGGGSGDRASAAGREIDYRTSSGTAFAESEWRSSMHVTLSFADGSPARTHAIQASLRLYKPAYFHFWQLKTFWHESKVVDDDIEVHSFESMETVPAVDTDRVRDVKLQRVVHEMRAFYKEMILSLSSDDNDIRRFWLRKSQKPVLAVLMVQSVDMKSPRLYRGTNMEVSMPTGSLCAERNAIGSALAANPNLRRQDLKLIAVLAVPPVVERRVPEDGRSSLRRVQSHSSFVEDMDMGTGERRVGSRKSSMGSEVDLPTTPAPASSEATSEDWIWSDDQHQLNERGDDGGIDSSCAMTTAPVRRISLFSKTPSLRTKRTVVVHGDKDINPLAPCGACNEWLKKIAESNPYFKILTFTDADCNGLYISSCQE